MSNFSDAKSFLFTATADNRPDLHVFATTGGLAGTNCFLLACDDTRQAVLFDAPDHTVAPMLDDLDDQDLDLVGLWLTHGHFDHLGDHAVVSKRFPGAKILIHELDLPKLHQPGSRMFPLPFEIPPGEADALIEDDQELSFGRQQCTVLFTPGHSPGHVMFHFAEHKLLVGGDLIIGGAVGRTDLPDSSEQKLNESIRRVMDLPRDTILLPGHGQPSRLEEEFEHNPYVKMALSER